MPLKTEATSRTESRSVLCEVSLYLCLHTCFCIYVYTVCTVCLCLWASKCVTETVGYILLNIYLREEEVNKWPGWPLPEVTMDLHM